MADKVVELEERLNRLEEKLRLTFGEIEKRLTQGQPQAASDIEERLQELEDLLLLLHLENTKLREKVGEGLDFGITPATPDISERLTRIESELATRSTSPIETDVDAKIAVLEGRINALAEGAPMKFETHPLHENVKELEKKVKTLEALLAEHGRKELEVEESTLLDDVRNILRG